MPIVHRHAVSGSPISILIRKNTESTTDLLEQSRLSDDEHRMAESFRSENRRREWLSTRLLLREIAGDDTTIRYDEFGKPHAEPSGFLSISHTGDFVAMIFSKSLAVGIDFETIRPSIRSLSKKFISSSELEGFSRELTLDDLHLIWGAKEVLYKLYGIGNVDFKKDLLVEPFPLQHTGNIVASIFKPSFNRTFEMNHQRIGDQMLVWAAG